VALDELAETLSQRLLSVGVTQEAIHATIRAPVPDGSDDALEVVRAIAAGSEPALSVTRTLGEGGMGIVQLGTQRALGREVALKTLRKDKRSDAAVSRLVREAVVTGSLEHPNIVPVYDLSLDEGGAPVLAMKRVEGSTWSERMRDEEGVRRRFGASDLLEWNLRTLASVCQAVHFAHSRGVVHRDLKPENVMVGEFGEVYVVDWGIAVRIGDARQTDPRAGTIVGTPAYMAPEMVLGQVVSPRTDVYLLGAILFEILTGRAPHDVPGGMIDLVRSVLASPPEVPAGAPPALAALARACMQRDEKDRPQSAEDVRRSLEEFLRHRGSAALATRAEARLGELAAALHEKGAEPGRLQRLYGEITFGFRAALESWPENAAARAGLARATRTFVRHELAQGLTRSARSRLADLLEPDPELEAEVEAANRRRDEEERKARKLREAFDPETGRIARVRVMLVLGTLWTLQPLVEHLGLLGPAGESFFAETAAVSFFLVVLVVGAFLVRRSLARSRLNQQLMGIVAFILVAQILAFGAASVTGMTPARTQTTLLFLWFVVCGILGTAFEVRIFIPCVGFLAAFFVAALHPPARLLAEAAGNLVLTIASVATWWRPKEDTAGNPPGPGAVPPA
jgi:serine/threonine-protein kinase